MSLSLLIALLGTTCIILVPALLPLPRQTRVAVRAKPNP